MKVAPRLPSASRGGPILAKFADHQLPHGDIIRRFAELDEEAKHLEGVRQKLNSLMSEDVLAARVKRGMWTPESELERKSKIFMEKQRNLF